VIVHQMFKQPKWTVVGNTSELKHVRMLWCLFVFFWSWGRCTDVIRIAYIVWCEWHSFRLQ
jgi:hypothetical protein